MLLHPGVMGRLEEPGVNNQDVKVSIAHLHARYRTALQRCLQAFTTVNMAKKNDWSVCTLPSQNAAVFKLKPREQNLHPPSSTTSRHEHYVCLSDGVNYFCVNLSIPLLHFAYGREPNTLHGVGEPQQQAKHNICIRINTKFNHCQTKWLRNDKSKFATNPLRSTHAKMYAATQEVPSQLSLAHFFATLRFDDN